MDRIINIRELTPGMVIVRVTQQNGPVRIKKSGLVTSQSMVQGLIEMGIQEVEVDPEQTVEVETPEVKMSATRKMLESNKVTNTRIDDGLSDHFHRSLFLPSVQDIPSAWLFYTKRYALAGFIAIGGFGMGWVLAHYEELKTILISNPVVQTAIEEPVVELVIPEANNVDATNSVVAATNANSGNAVSSPTLQSQPKPIEDKITKQVIVKPEVVEEPEPVSPKVEEQPISADLLARFREAVSEVGDEPIASETKNNSTINGVSRIDQLPVWVLTELPNMSFSAHMYASNDAERWVRVNGTRMIEGDMIDDKVEIVNISPQMVILSYEGHEFSMDALTDW